MATLRDIRRRINSVRNTRQITSAMRMVSAAKLNRAQQAVRRAQPFSDRLADVVRRLSYGLTAEDHPFFGGGEGGKTLVVHFTSDRGLCGGFNSNLNKFVLRAVQDDGALKGAEFAVFGRQGNEFMKRRGVNIRTAIVQTPDVERRRKLEDLCTDITEQFAAGKLNKVLVAYNRFVNPIKQDPTLEPLLPIAPREERRHGGRSTIFEPNLAEILAAMLPRYLNNQFQQAMLNTEAGEHGARMVAMEGATKNAGKMMDSLTLQYNRARQAGITKELIEIVNGAQSL